METHGVEWRSHNKLTSVILRKHTTHITMGPKTLFNSKSSTRNLTAQQLDAGYARSKPAEQKARNPLLGEVWRLTTGCLRRVRCVVYSLRKGGSMSTKELIQAEIDPLSDEELDELYTLIKNFTQSKRHAKPQRLSEN